MTVAMGPRAAQAVGKKELVQLQRVGRAPRSNCNVRGADSRLLLAVLAALVMLTVPANHARAEIVRVNAGADAGLPQVLARQQALERALIEAVSKEARHLLPGPVAEPRLAALRAHLAPHALDYVLTYQEVATAKPSPEAQAENALAPPPQQKQPQQGAPLELELDVDVHRAFLRQTMVRLGFFAGNLHPGAYVLRLGPGVTEKDAKVLEAANPLLGLARGQQNAAGAAPEVTLERLPQGYYKAVLRQGGTALAADAADLTALWFEVWGKYFADTQRQAGPGMQRLTIAGFANVDAVAEFLQAVTGWDEALQDPKLASIELESAGINAQFTCRVVSQQALDARLREALPARKLSLASQTGLAAQAGGTAP